MSAAPSVRAVIAEDDMATRVLSAALRTAGVDARVAVTVIGMILEIARDPPDVAVVDLSVPLDGAGPALSVDARLAILRHHWRGPLLLWSGRDDIEAVAARWGLAFLQKPVDLGAIADAIRAVAHPASFAPAGEKGSP